MLVLTVQDIITSQGNNKLLYLLLMHSEVMILLFGWLSKEQQSRFLLLPKTQSTQNYSCKFIIRLWDKKKSALT